MTAAAFTSLSIDIPPGPITSQVEISEESGAARCLELFYEDATRGVARSIDEDDARLIAIEALARALENPLWRMSVRYNLPLEPLVNCALTEIVADWEAGWRPPVA